MKVTLSWQQTTTQDFPSGTQVGTTTLEGKPAEILDAIEQLFSADHANGLRREFGLKATSAFGNEDHQ